MFLHMWQKKPPGAEKLQSHLRLSDFSRPQCESETEPSFEARHSFTPIYCLPSVSNVVHLGATLGSRGRILPDPPLPDFVFPSPCPLPSRTLSIQSSEHCPSDYPCPVTACSLLLIPVCGTSPGQVSISFGRFYNGQFGRFYNVQSLTPEQSALSCCKTGSLQVAEQRPWASPSTAKLGSKNM